MIIIVDIVLGYEMFQWSLVTFGTEQSLLLCLSCDSVVVFVVLNVQTVTLCCRYKLDKSYLLSYSVILSIYPLDNDVKVVRSARVCVLSALYDSRFKTFIVICTGSTGMHPDYLQIPIKLWGIITSQRIHLYFHNSSFQNVSLSHAHQSTGLCACCKRYGDLSLANLLVCFREVVEGPSLPDAMLIKTDELGEEENSTT